MRFLKSSLKAFLLLVLVLIVVPATFAQLPPEGEPTPAPEPTEVNLDGTWKGNLLQAPANPGMESYSIVLTVKGLDSVTVNYPSLSCNGYMNLVRANEKSATFRETITNGCENCYSGGIVVITKLDAETANVKWSDPDPKRGVICRGKVSRVSD